MIIGICGLIGSGKGTVADMLCDIQGFTKMSFADSLKDAVAAVFNWPRHLLEGDTDESRSWREEVDQWWAKRLGMPNLTPRWVLQNWGTEVCRQGFHEDIWIASMERKLSAADNINIVIPDTRFPNEIDMVQKLGGEVWRVKRGDDPDWLDRYVRGSYLGLMTDATPVDVHPSEWAWARSMFNKIIYNDSSMEDLQANVTALSSIWTKVD
jgi:hypothetical protein